MTSIHASLAFFSLAMAILTMWVKRSPWIWGSFLILAFTLGFLAKLITPIALAPIVGLLILHALLNGDVKGPARFTLVLITVGLSVGLMMPYFPGFTNWPIIKGVQISKEATPYNLFLNFRNPFIGIFVLAMGFPLVTTLRELGAVMRKTFAMALCGVLLLIFLSLYSGLVRFDPKLPDIFWFFLVENLIFTCVIEEAFYRGFIQRELFSAFGGRGFLANTSCVLFTALFFAARHWFWVQSLPFLSLVFVAGIIYGSIYQYTKSLEASIFTHWLFNIIHFLLFTYPVLRSDL